MDNADHIALIIDGVALAEGKKPIEPAGSD